MSRTVMRQGLLLGAILATSSVAPAPHEKLPSSPPLLERRYNAALKLYDVAWVYWREKRINVPMLHGCSLEVLKAECDLRNDPVGRMAAFEAHEKRFKSAVRVPSVAKIGIVHGAQALTPTERAVPREPGAWDHARRCLASLLEREIQGGGAADRDDGFERRLGVVLGRDRVGD
jgi:hypothetical protein